MAGKAGSCGKSESNWGTFQELPEQGRFCPKTGAGFSFAVIIDSENSARDFFSC
jgi:hypothetical protein